jgi:hypothetical protein
VSDNVLRLYYFSRNLILRREKSLWGCFGAKADFLPKRLENKIRKISEKIVKVIDLEASK